jgi:glycogen operon protein
MEWNGGFRDAIRRWVRGDAGMLGALREKLNGSPETFAGAGREPWASVNFAASHDGFTLRDLVSYDHKHNEENGEENWDGGNDNHSWNCGEEGETGRAAVEELRRRQARNLFLLAALSRGTPMLLGGDEFLRTQGGNNNAYCQDNAVSWIDWSRAETQADFLRFCRNILAWRSAMGISNRWGDPSQRAWGRCWEPHDSAGRPVSEKEEAAGRHAAFLLHTLPQGARLPDEAENGVGGGGFYLLLNAEDEEKTFHLPHLPPPWRWAMVADTSFPTPEDVVETEASLTTYLPDRYEAAPNSSVLLRAVRG